MSICRQGDLYIQQVDALPSACKSPLGKDLKGQLRRASFVLVRGEATGHAHRIESGADADVYLTQFTDASRPGDVFFVQVRGQCTRLLHEEHAPIDLEPGIYRIWRQREYAPAAIRPVVD